MTSPEDMKRLYLVVRGRSNIQYAAHELLGLMRKHRDIISSESVANDKWELLVAATFSLWRAVFLADGVSDWDSILANAETFLEKLIRDNAIGYVDDWNNRSWSFIYYLNNARFRLKELADTWPEFKASLGNIADCLDQPIVGSHSLNMWEDHCTALQMAISVLDKNGAFERWTKPTLGEG